MIVVVIPKVGGHSLSGVVTIITEIGSLKEIHLGEVGLAAKGRVMKLKVGSLAKGFGKGWTIAQSAEIQIL